MPRHTKKNDPTPTCNDVRDMSAGTVTHVVMDDRLPGGPRQKTNHAAIWAPFEERFA